MADFVFLLIVIVGTSIEATTYLDGKGFAQSTMTLSTDKSDYVFGDLVIISGNVGKPHPGQMLSVGILSDDGKTSQIISDVHVNDDGSYDYSFELMTLNEGQYTAYAKYCDGEVRSDFSYFVGASSMSFRPFNLSYVLEEENLAVSGRSSESVVMKQLVINPNKSLDIELKTDPERHGLVEIMLPKRIIEGLNHVEILATDYSTQTEFRELSSNAADTLIQVAIPRGAERMIITGAYVIPEFSMISLLVLTASMVMIIVIVQRVKNHRSLFLS